MKKMLSGKNAQGVLLAMGTLLGFVLGGMLSSTLVWLLAIALIVYIGWVWYKST